MGTSTNKNRVTNSDTKGPSGQISRYLNSFNPSLHNNDISQVFYTRDNDAQTINRVKNSTSSMMKALVIAGMASFGSWAIENDTFIANTVITRILDLLPQKISILSNPDNRREFCQEIIQEVFPNLPHAEDQDMLIYSMDQAIADIFAKGEEISTVDMIHYLVEASLQARLNLIIENHIEEKITTFSNLGSHEFIGTIRRCIRDASQLCDITVPINTSDFSNIVRDLWLDIINIIQGA